MSRLAILLAGLAACGGTDHDNELENAGVLCAWSLSDTGTVGTSPFEIGRPVRIDLRYDVVKAACPVDLEATCDVDRSGTTLRFATRVTWNDAPAGTDCTREAKVATVQCQLEPLDAGTYTLRHGSSTATLVMPSADSGVCLDPPAPPSGGAEARGRAASLDPPAPPSGGAEARGRAASLDPNQP